MRTPFMIAVAGVVSLTAGSAVADPVAVEALLEPQEQMKYEFADGSDRFVLAVRREGTAEGSGVFAGAEVTEFGWHDVDPPTSGAPLGYLEITTEEGDVAILRWSVTATFLKGEDGPALINHGVWELTSGTGRFEDQRGVGSLVLEPQGGPTLFILDGEVGDRP